ncbi:MAG: ribosome assembly factor SBDS [Candidatus Nezhaarchaeales archaeon]
MSGKPGYVIARLTVGKERFEILVKPDVAWQIKRGKQVDVSSALVSTEIYKDAKKGLKSSQESVRASFKTTNPLEVAEAIIKRGEIQLTIQQRKELIEAKRKQVIDFIARNCVDPKTGVPHPPTRIDNALNEAKFSVDPFEDPKEQALKAIQALKTIIPIKMAQALLAIKIPAAYASRAYGILSNFGVIKRSAWGSDGSWIGEIEVPAGLQPALIDRLNSVTRGEVEVKVLR